MDGNGCEALKAGTLNAAFAAEATSTLCRWQELSHNGSEALQCCRHFLRKKPLIQNNDTYHKTKANSYTILWWLHTGVSGMDTHAICDVLRKVWFLPDG